MILIFSVISDHERSSLNKLIVCVQNGEKQALGEIYRIAGGRMLSVAMGLVRNKQLAEDVLHDSFIKVVQFCGHYKKGTNAYAWLCSIVRNTALNKIKSEKLRAGPDIESFFNLADNLAPAELDNVIMIEAAVKSLAPRERTVIWLKYYNDMTVRDIAKELSMSRSTVQDTVSAAEKKLKKLLKEDH